jgi:hypothetical protein
LRSIREVALILLERREVALILPGRCDDVVSAEDFEGCSGRMKGHAISEHAHFVHQGANRTKTRGAKRMANMREFWRFLGDKPLGSWPGRQ